MKKGNREHEVTSSSHQHEVTNLFLLAYLGGILTIISPCILPVIPFVLARADRPFLRDGLPILVGMTLAFAVVASLASVAGGWVVSANQYGRLAALVLLAAFGLTLIFPELADRAMQPLVGIGTRISQSAERAGEGSVAPLVLGIATGFLWAPCAGPILGLDPDGRGAPGRERPNHAAATGLCRGGGYVAGSGACRWRARLCGHEESIGAGEWVRRGLGAAVLAAVVAIALGLDTGFLTNLSLGNTTALEQNLLDKLRPGQKSAMAGSSMMRARPTGQPPADLPVEVSTRRLPAHGNG